MNYILLIIAVVVSFAIGASITYFIQQRAIKTRSKNIIKDAEVEAEVIKKEKILQAKEKFFQLKTEHEKIINEKNLY